MASPNAERPAAAVAANGPQEADLLGGTISSFDRQPNAKKQESGGNGFYVPKSLKPKRVRRTKAFIANVRDGIRDILEQDHPQTVRQVFYALTVRGLIDKVEQEYHRTVIRLLTQMCEAGAVPFDWIADNTRWMRKPATFVGLDHCLNSTARDIEAKLRRYAPEAEIHFERVAVTREQVEVWNLPSRPTKATDTRAKKFIGTSVELDAIPGKKLRSLARDRIGWHVDQEQLKVLRVAEQSERDTLAKWAKMLNGGGRP